MTFTARKQSIMQKWEDSIWLYCSISDNLLLQKNGFLSVKNKDLNNL